MLALTETQTKGNGKTSWCKVIGSRVGVLENESALKVNTNKSKAMLLG